MPLYEHVFMARQDVSAAQVETLLEQFKAVLEENGGSVGKTEYWGLRSLAYKIKKNRKAHYALMNIDAQPDVVAEMERRMRLSPDVLRFLTLRVEEHETEPSVQMRKSDDRGGSKGGRSSAQAGASTFRAKPAKRDQAEAESEE